MLVMPVFAFFMFFAFDYSRVIIAKWTVMNMARVGVRMAVMQGAQNHPSAQKKLQELDNVRPEIKRLASRACKGKGTMGSDCIAAATAILAMGNQFQENHKREFTAPLYYKWVTSQSNDSDLHKYIKINTPTDRDLGKEIKTANMNNEKLQLAVQVCMDVKIQMPIGSNGKTVWGNVTNGFTTVCHAYASAHSQIDQKS